jgi:hypothetical protein
VNLSIFNIKGERIEILQNGFLSAGSHTYNWQAELEPSGVYFYTLDISGKERIVEKCILLK